MHQKVVKKVLCYLKGTIKPRLFYKREGGEHLVSFCDNDYARDLKD